MLDLTLGPSFKVKQWFNGFGELSLRWIQICKGLRCVGLAIGPRGSQYETISYKNHGLGIFWL